MKNNTKQYSIKIHSTTGRCPIGETVGIQNITEGKIPVLSCEGGCIRGEIARLAANIVAKENGFARGCHGEFITVPESAIAQWMRHANKVVLIDGCFLRCHGRILENILEDNQLVQFDALKVYKKYTDCFDIDDVSESERKMAAKKVAGHVLAELRNGKNS